MRIVTQVPRRPAMSLTPLIDVVFILLLFFMLASSFVQWSTLPLSVSPSTSSAAESTERRQVVVVRGDGMVLLKGRPMSDEALFDFAVGERERKPSSRFVVRAEHGGAVARVVAVMDLLGRAGVSNVALQRVAE